MIMLIIIIIILIMCCYCFNFRLKFVSAIMLIIIIELLINLYNDTISRINNYYFVLICDYSQHVTMTTIIIMELSTHFNIHFHTIIQSIKTKEARGSFSTYNIALISVVSI